MNAIVCTVYVSSVNVSEYNECRSALHNHCLCILQHQDDDSQRILYKCVIDSLIVRIDAQHVATRHCEVECAYKKLYLPGIFVSKFFIPTNAML